MSCDGEHAQAAEGRGSLLRYLAILRAARDLGLLPEQTAAVAGPFCAARPRCDELADALADLILARARWGGCSG
jgi:hypothetical protein